MRYLYECKDCKKEVEIVKPMMESSKEEFCEDCGNKLDRVYTASTIKTADGTKS